MVKEFGDKSPENRSDLREVAGSLAKIMRRSGGGKQAGKFGNDLTEALIQGWL